MNDIEILEKYVKLLDDTITKKAIENLLKRNKELETKNKELNIIRLNMLLGQFPDTTETYKKYKKELDELLETS